MSEEDFNFLTKKIIGNTPRWIVRWGITVILITLVSLVTILSLIKYPVSVYLPATIEYARQPAPIVAPAKAILTGIYVERTGVVEKGVKIMVLESADNKVNVDITAPVTGNLYLSENWKVNSFINNNQRLGFVVPEPNERIIKLTISASKFKNLKQGQKVMVKVNNNNNLNLDLQGNIDFISPGFSSQSYFVTVRFSPAINKQLFSYPALNTLDSINCQATLTVDTISYLSYIFKRSRIF